MEVRNILPAQPLEHPRAILPGGLHDFNPDPSVLCSTMNAVPATSGMLNKMKLPFAIHVHPFKDLDRSVR